MAATIATSRLRKELTLFMKDPPPGIVAEPKDNDILTWFYALKGPVDSVYEGGTYIGKLQFPKEFPLKPPGIQMLTPSGRFRISTRLCLSISDFHPESWQPSWSVTTILLGIQTFMVSDEITTGAIKTSDSERRKLAKLSAAYNQKHYGHLFDGNINKTFCEANEAIQKAKTAMESQATAIAKLSISKSKGKSRRAPISSNKTNDICNKDNAASNAKTEPCTSLSPEEQEKRRKKNLKKRLAKKRARERNKNKVTSSEDNNEKESAEE